jgi:hypothetical protein
MLKEFCSTTFFPPDFDLHAHIESLIITEVTDSLDCVIIQMVCSYYVFLKDCNSLYEFWTSYFTNLYENIKTEHDKPLETWGYWICHIQEVKNVYQRLRSEQKCFISDSYFHLTSVEATPSILTCKFLCLLEIQWHNFFSHMITSPEFSNVQQYKTIISKTSQNKWQE